MNRYLPLRRFLLASFAREQYEPALRRSRDGLLAATVDEVVFDAPHSQVVDALLLALDRQNLFREFFDLLREERPAKVAEIDAIEEACFPEWHAPALAAWRARVRRRHQHLVPFFQEQLAATLDALFVDLELGVAEIGRPREPGPREATLDGRVTLRELLAGQGGAWHLVGEPGAGKTTLLRHLAWELAGQEAAPVPIFLSLARVSRENLADPLSAAWAEPAAWPGARNEARRALLRVLRVPGSAWILLDGLDEVGPEVARPVREWIASLVEAGHVVVVGTRRVALEHDVVHTRFRRATVLPLDDTRRDLLIRKLLIPLAADQLIGELDRSPRLAELCANPLLLTMLVFTVRDAAEARRAVPSTRIALFGKTIELLLRRGHGLEPTPVQSPWLVLALLRQLSLRLQCDGGEDWPEEHVDAALWSVRRAQPELGERIRDTRAYDGNNDRVVADIGANSGILGPFDGPAWKYLHRSLREFLAAAGLWEQGQEAVEAWEEAWIGRGSAATAAEIEAWNERCDDDPRCSEAQRAADRWGEVAVLACALARDPWSRLERLRRASPALARRALLGVDGLDEDRALEFLWADARCDKPWDPSVPGWRDAEFLWLVRSWAGSAAGRAALWRRVTPEADIATLALLHYGLEVAGGRLDARFFAACGRDGKRPNIAKCAIPRGTFIMGSERGEPREQPRHPVTLTQDYALSRTPVTVSEYRMFEPSIRGSPDHPAAGMNWYEARLFCAWVGGSLPTEAEWERACRGGVDADQDYWAGDGEAVLSAIGWFRRNSRSRAKSVATPPSQAGEHPWGLHDLHGNVWEWCEDGWRSYTLSPAVDPRGGAGRDRALRGGGNWDRPEYCRTASRYGSQVGGRSASVGFRVRFSL